MGAVLTSNDELLAFIVIFRNTIISEIEECFKIGTSNNHFNKMEMLSNSALRS